MADDSGPDSGFPEDLDLSDLPEEAREIYKQYTKIFISDSDPVTSLIKAVRELNEVIRGIPYRVSNELPLRIRNQFDSLLRMFIEDVDLLIKSGSLKKLSEEEKEYLSGAVKDVLESLLSLVLRLTAEIVSKEVKWIESNGTELDLEALELKMKMYLDTLVRYMAKLAYERDMYREKYERVKQGIRVKMGTEMKILETLERASKPIRANEIAFEVHRAEVTVRKYLKNLVSKELVEEIKLGNTKYYKLKDKDWISKLARDEDEKSKGRRDKKGKKGRRKEGQE